MDEGTWATGRLTTVRGPIEPSELGVTDAHDHLFLRTPALAGQETQDPEKAIVEVREAQAGGLQSFVDLTPIGLGRRPDLLREVSRATGAHIIGATGFHRDAHYPADHWVYAASDEQLVERMQADIEQGMHPSDWDGDPDARDAARAGVIKLGASYQHISASERRRMELAGAVAKRTGVAVVVHTEIGTCADQVISVLESAGLASDRIVLAHMDRNPDAEWHRELLERGVRLVYDTPGRIKYQPDSALLDLIEAMTGAGFADRLMLGLDLGQRFYFRAYGGGPGLAYLMDVFVPRLRRRIGDAAVDQILIANPARAFAVA